MKFFNNLSIRYKLIFIIFIVTLPVIGVGFGIAIYYNSQTLKNDMIQNTIVNAKLIGEYCVVPLAFQDTTGAKRVLNRLETVQDITDGILYDSNMHYFAEYHRNHDTLTIPLTKAAAMYYYKGNYLHVFQPIIYQNDTYGTIYLKASDAEVRKKIRNSYAFMTPFVISLIGLSYLFAFILQKWISYPILKLAKVSEKISMDADLSLRVKKKGTDELGILYSSFNAMLEQLHYREMERDKADAQIKESLREKEVMLKEIHHRVKNNLQVISSLLSLQSKHIHDAKALEMFKDCQSRVRSMALVHEKLYQSQDLASIDFSEYIKSLVNSLFRTYCLDPNRINCVIQVEDISLSIDLAVPCGLIIHELVSNSIKHAFKDSKNDAENKIEIIVKKLHAQGEKERYRMVIRDNGRGIPKNIEFKNSDSLGLRLTGILVEEQLMGSIQLDRSKGTQYTIDI